MNEKKAIGQRAYETQLLLDRLKALQPEELVSYSELARLAGMDVRPNTAGYDRLWSARRATEREAGFLVGVVAGEGVKRLSVNEQAAIAPHQLKTMRRRNRRALGRMGHVEYAKLNQSQQVEHNITASVMGVVDFATRPKTVAKIAGAAAQASAKLPIGDVVKLFNGNGSK